MKYQVMSSDLISTTLKRSVRKKAVTKNSDEKKVKNRQIESDFRQ